MTEKAGKQVKCLVCGAVFDAEEEICPVCGVGAEHFVPVEEEPPTEAAREDEPAADAAAEQREEERFVIIGSGIAAVAAAEEIRRILPAASIVLIGEEHALPYCRTSLSKEALTPQVGERFALHPPEWYSRQGIFLLFGRRATRVLTGQKQIELSDGEVLSYDKCIFATGARAAVPPIEGRSLRGVFVLRTAADFEAIARHIRPDMRAAVIGGGVLGLESAWQLRRAGCQVTVLEAAERLFAGRLTEEIADRILGLAAARGVEIRTGVTVSRLEGEESVRQVIMPGEYLNAELVLLCCGTRPRVEEAAEAGLEIDGGIVVNSRMMTGKYGVYACGDCARIGREGCGMWNTAENMGRCAGRNAAGEDSMYQPCPTPLMTEVFGTRLFAAGDCGTGGRQYRIEREGEGKTLYYAEGRLCGAVLMGDISQASALLRQLECGAALSIT